MSNETPTPAPRKQRWGIYFATAIIVAILCIGVLFYIGWFNNKTHVDSVDGDNVKQDYAIETAQPEAPGVNDWENPDHSSMDEVIVDHAEGTDPTPRGE
ncbi:MAG: hypothetical protein UHP27_05635 [Muribaculaceae bacterium]|nr:hypothetical protein [Muribaculaceae bacterium]